MWPFEYLRGEPAPAELEDSSIEIDESDFDDYENFDDLEHHVSIFNKAASTTGFFGVRRPPPPIVEDVEEADEELPRKSPTPSPVGIGTSINNFIFDPSHNATQRVEDLRNLIAVFEVKLPRERYTNEIDGPRMRANSRCLGTCWPSLESLENRQSRNQTARTARKQDPGTTAEFQPEVESITTRLVRRNLDDSDRLDYEHYTSFRELSLNIV